MNERCDTGLDLWEDRCEFGPKGAKQEVEADQGVNLGQRASLDQNFKPLNRDDLTPFVGEADLCSLEFIHVFNTKALLILEAFAEALFVDKSQWLEHFEDD